MELSDFQRRLLGFPANALSAIMPDASATPEQQDMADARMQSMGQMGALLLAAGQRQTPQNRALILSRLANVSDPNEIAMTAAQRRLMGVKMQQAQDEMARQNDLRGKLSDPAYLAGIGITPQQAQLLGPEGIAQILQTRAGRNPLDDDLKRAQIAHYMRPDKVDTPSPQMVDTPSGKGWVMPGSTTVTPIEGTGKPEQTAEQAKRADSEKDSLTYAKEAIAANRMLSDPKYFQPLTQGYREKFLNRIPALNGSWAGEQYSSGDRAANNFIDSVVRPRSGAKIGDDELANNKAIFTPTAGDPEDELLRKTLRRTQHIESLIAGAHPADRPMLQKMYEDSIAELKKAYPKAFEAKSQNSLPAGVRSIVEVQ